MRKWARFIVAITAAGGLATGCVRPPSPSGQALLTVGEARSLPTAQLATKVLGPLLGRRVIEAVRYEYDPSGGPQKVEFYSQPETPWPRLNRICSIDVITVEYNWFELSGVDDATPLEVKRVSAESRYKSFADPKGEPGTEAYQLASDAACARMRTATDAFRAPSAGDAQWLAAIEKQYLGEVARRGDPSFGCDDFADSTCAEARAALGQLDLKSATTVALVDCDLPEQGWVLSRCYRLVFPYPGEDDPEWVLTVMGGIRTGSSPVETRSLTLKHVPKPIVLY